MLIRKKYETKIEQTCGDHSSVSHRSEDMKKDTKSRKLCQNNFLKKT